MKNIVKYICDLFIKNKKHEIFGKDLALEQLKYIKKLIPVYLDRLNWDKKQIEQFQLKKLKEILKIAKTKSKWHSKRLNKINIDKLNLKDLSKLLPIMTKQDLMNNWDDIVTDQRLKLKIANKAFNNSLEHRVYFGKYHFWASGGSTGTRGLFAWSTEDYAHFVVGTYRQFLANLDKYENNKKNKIIKAAIVAVDRIHMSNYLWGLHVLDNMEIHELSVSWDLKKLVTELNKIKPDCLTCFTSVMVALASEKNAGRLDISLKRIDVICEPMFRQERKTIEQAFSCPVINFYGASETGPHGLNDYDTLDLMLCDDCVIIEPIDKNGNPTKIGEYSDKIYVTSLINKTMPLIRYEITDQVCICKDNFKNTAFKKSKPVTGRTDEGFNYKVKSQDGSFSDIYIHRMDFVDGLLKDSNISEYQVIQTLNGANISFESSGEVDICLVKNIIENLLEKHGIDKPEISLTQVKSLPRHPETGKLKRFICL